jgi:hypothetical protein
MVSIPQNNIRLSRQFFIMQPVPVPTTMQKPPHQHFGFGIPAFYPAHIKTALGYGMYIGHRIGQ